MAKIATRILFFTPSISADIIGHHVRILEDGTEFTYDAPFSLVPDDSPMVGDNIEIDLASLSVAPTEEGVYDIYVTAVDGAGNESSPLEIVDKVIDFNPPAAPADGGLK
jgi:hypothetical protein